MKVVIDPGAFMPTRAHKSDAGLDLFSPVDFALAPRSTVVVITGVHIELDKGYAGIIKSRSSFFKRGIITDGLIDEGYNGKIGVMLINTSDESISICAGDRIAQLVIIPVSKPQIEIVEELATTERGNGGFGSTGK